jgi:hypothetical protein
VVPAEALDRGPGRLTPTGGTFTTEGAVLVFRPRHPFAPGTTYALVGRADGRPAGLLTYPAAGQRPRAVVTAIHPGARAVPVNLLRVYVHFSAPMSEGLALRGVRLEDAATGEELPGALLPMEPELWDPARTRLTVLLDPGRIKRGLAPHEEACYPLVAGRTVRLVVDPALRDATGAPLAGAAQREYAVGPAVRRLVDPAQWAVARVTPATRDPLRVRFDRPLDHALALRCLHVADAHGGRVAGETTLADDGLDWVFVPRTPWPAAALALAVAPELEDLAGNSVVRVFDRDLTDPAHEPPAVPALRRPLTSGPASP